MVNPKATLQPIINKLRQTKADDERAVYEENKLRREYERAKARKAINVQDKTARRMNEMKLAIQNHKVELLEEMEKNFRAQIEHETMSDIREAVYNQQAETADDYKHEIKDQARERLIEELEPVVKSEIAAQFENEVKEQVVAELRLELRSELGPTLRAEIEAELREELKAALETTLRADLEAEILAQYDFNKPDDHLPTLSTRQNNTIQAKIEAQNGSQYGKPDDYLSTLETQQEYTIQPSIESENYAQYDSSRPGKRRFSEEMSEYDSPSVKKLKQSPSDNQTFDFSGLQHRQVHGQQATNEQNFDFNGVQDGKLYGAHAIKDEDLALHSAYNKQHAAEYAIKDEGSETELTQNGQLDGQSDSDDDANPLEYNSQEEADTDEDPNSPMSSDEEDLSGEEENSQEDTQEDSQEESQEEEEEIEEQYHTVSRVPQHASVASGVISWTNTPADALVIDESDEEEESTLVGDDGFVAVNKGKLMRNGLPQEDLF